MLEIIVQVLLIVGAVNWGLVGLFNLNLVALLFGTSLVANIIYVLVGIAGVYQLYPLIKGKLNK